jgi:hypothetical protein
MVSLILKLFKIALWKLNGFAVDLGFNYQLKDTNGYKVNAGVSVKNIGGMTLKMQTMLQITML